MRGDLSAAFKVSGFQRERFGSGGLRTWGVGRCFGDIDRRLGQAHRERSLDGLQFSKRVQLSLVIAPPTLWNAKSHLC